MRTRTFRPGVPLNKDEDCMGARIRDETADGVDFELGIAAGLPSNMIEREVLMA